VSGRLGIMGLRMGMRIKMRMKIRAVMMSIEVKKTTKKTGFEVLAMMITGRGGFEGAKEEEVDYHHYIQTIKGTAYIVA
jgi:hypothetical protein